MKTTNRSRFITILACVFIVAAGVMAQNRQNIGRPNNDSQPDNRSDALRQLGLTPVQIRQFREINRKRKPLMDDAQKRFRMANRALDEIIYADNVTEGEFQARLRDFQLAQAEVAKVRFTSEYAIRRILTPEQLVRFRQMRLRFERSRENMDNTGTRDRSRPMVDVSLSVASESAQNQIDKSQKRPKN